MYCFCTVFRVATDLGDTDMKKYLLAAAVTAGALVAPTAALAAKVPATAPAAKVRAAKVPAAARAAKVPGHEGGFVALSEPGVAVAIRPGQTVPVTMGVAYNGNVSPLGAVLRVTVAEGLKLPRTFGNCWYFVAGGTDGAWCEFDRRLTMSVPYVLSSFEVTAEARISAVTIGGISVEWRGDAPGGIEALAEKDAGPGTTPVTGTGGALTLEVTDKLVLTQAGPPTGVVPVQLVTPPPTEAAPDTAPTAPPAPPAPPAGGELPITGSTTALVAGAGILLVLAGAIGVRVARRRTRFLA